MADRGSLRDRVAVVTGASRGIGKGIAVELGAAGATVYVTGRSVQEGRLPGTISVTAREISDMGGRGIAVRCDHRDDVAVAALFEQVRSDHGTLDVLVNNVYDAPGSARWLGKPFWEVPGAGWDHSFDIGVRSHYVSSSLAAPLLMEATAGGLIVNVSSPGAVRYTHNVVYGVAKAALDRMTADMAHDLEGRRVTAVSVWPGIVNTELLQAIPPDRNGRRILRMPGEEDYDLAAAESPRFAGRAVVALAADGDREARAGRAFYVADLASEYGFTDIDGRVPQPPVRTTGIQGRKDEPPST